MMTDCAQNVITYFTYFNGRSRCVIDTHRGETQATKGDSAIERCSYTSAFCWALIKYIIFHSLWMRCFFKVNILFNEYYIKYVDELSVYKCEFNW